MTKEPVIFERVFIAIAGANLALVGFFYFAVTVVRALNPVAPGLPPPQLPRPLQVISSLAFTLGVGLLGVSVIMLAFSNRVWKTSS